MVETKRSPPGGSRLSVVMRRLSRSDLGVDVAIPRPFFPTGKTRSPNHGGDGETRGDDGVAGCKSDATGTSLGERGVATDLGRASSQHDVTARGRQIMVSSTRTRI